jgi:hypothetical protein
MIFPMPTKRFFARIEFYVIVFMSLHTLAAGKVYIDDNNAAIVDGKPFFPLGLYTGARPASDDAIKALDEIADSPFNTIMNYGVNEASIQQIRRYLDAVDERGLKIIYSIKDFYRGTKYYPRKVGHYSGEEEMTRGVISTFRNHPAILAWYLNDELPPEYIPRLARRYRTVKRLDPNHPAWIVLYQVNELKSYLKTTDVIGADPYPIPHRPIGMAGEWTQLARKAVGPKRAVWMVPQAHNTSLYRKDGAKYAGPTFDEMRCMAYQCLVHGANGLIFYSFFDLKRDPLGFESRWADVKNLGAEIKSLIPVLLSADEPPKVQLSSGVRQIHFSAKRHGGKLYILAVNASREEQDAEFTISAEVKEAKVLFKNRSLSVEKYRLTDKFQPIAVHVYEIVVMSVGSPIRMKMSF